MKHKRPIEIGKVEAHLSNVVLPVGLNVHSVKISGEGLHFSHHPLAWTTESPGSLEVFVSENDLAAFLNQMPQSGLKNVTVEAKGGSLHIRVTKTILIDVKAYAVCGLRIVDRTKLYVDLQSVEVMGVGPKQLIQTQLDKINPVVDAADFPVRARIDTVEITKGGILLKGTVEPED